MQRNIAVAVRAGSADRHAQRLRMEFSAPTPADTKMRVETILKCVPLLATAIAAPAFAQSAAPEGLSEFITNGDATAEAVLYPVTGMRRSTRQNQFLIFNL
jgi:hypothetical protein